LTKHFDFTETPLDGLYVIRRQKIGDSRGFLSRFFCADEFRSIGLTKQVVQINHTLTKKKGSVRGMHYQNPPYTEIKIVSCIKGEILDVAVDIRSGSSTFLQWHSEVLSADNQASLYIPEGFAHGFQALSDDCELIYLHTEFYEKSSEGALNARDPVLLIDWSLPISEISDRDRSHPEINNNFKGIQI